MNTNGNYKEYTKIDQFDMHKINKLARLESIPGFNLLKSERAYLNAYRALLKRNIEKSVKQSADAEMAKRTKKTKTIEAEPIVDNKE